ncbi:MAG: hypothetical protein Q9209_006675 [Squamulea sp. 1 TL-2023]
MPYSQSPLQQALSNLTGIKLAAGPIARLLSNGRDLRFRNRDNDFRSRHQVRHTLQTLAALHHDPEAKAHLKTEVRQFKLELRQSRRKHRDGARAMRKENAEELKAQRKGNQESVENLR